MTMFILSSEFTMAAASVFFTLHRNSLSFTMARLLPFFCTYMFTLQNVVTSIKVNSWAPTTDNVTVATDGTGHYLTISEAVEAAPINRNIRYFINVKPRVYQENVRIPEDKTYIALIGSGADNTKITANLSMLHGFGITKSATLDVKGNNFLLQDITVENSAGLGSIVGQAVALSSTSDFSVYYKTTIIGYQDTLYAWKGLQFYRDCNIYGSVDFIFGDATAVFQNCNLYARLPDTVFTAQSRDSMSSTSGYVMQNCSFTNSPELKSSLPNAKIYLGRPWRKFATVIVMESFLDSIISPDGWTPMGDVGGDNVLYREYNNRGSGSNTDRRVPWAGYKVLRQPWEAIPYTVNKFINGSSWIPETQVQYYGDLTTN